MIKRILLPVDASGYSTAAFEYAGVLAKKYGAQINILHIIDIKIVAGNFLTDMGALAGVTPYFNLKRDISTILNEKAKILLQIYSDKCKKAKIAFSAASAEGIVSKKIAEAALLNDIIVMGLLGENASHTHSLIGSTAENVIRNCTKPVLLTPEKPRKIKNLLLAYDGSNSAKNALKMTAELINELKLSPTVLSVNNSKPAALKTADEAIKYFASYKIKSKVCLEKGTPAKSILEKAASFKSDLIIMGSHGHGLIRDLILGSTTEEVIRKSKLPVLLIR